MIIKNGEMSLVVEDVGIAVDRVTQIAIDNGGYVLSSQSWNTGENVGATLTIAVQAASFETALRRLREIAVEVRTESATGQDVSAEYVDLESRLRNLEATRDRVRTFLDQAGDVEEALSVNDELSSIEAEIEQVKGRMNYLTGRAAFSTITVDLANVVEAAPTPTPTPAPPWSLNPTIKNAVETQTSLLRGLSQALIWMAIVLGPYALIVAVILGGAWAFARRRRNSA